MRRNLFERALARVAYYWVSVLIALIAGALIVALVFAACPEVSDAWQRHLHRRVTDM